MMRIRQLMRIELGRDERLRWLGSSALALALAVGIALLVGPVGAGAPQSVLANAGTASAAPRARIIRADMHAETTVQGKDWEVNVALTQTENDCQAPLHGGVCLRYSIVVDESGYSAGYGVIPASDVVVTPQAITLHVDTRTTPHFTQVIGSGMSLSITWNVGRQASTGRIPMGQTASSLASVQPPATTAGAVGTFVIPNVGPTDGLVATMIVG